MIVQAGELPRSGRFFVGKSGFIILLHMDCAAVDKTKLFYQPLHDLIVTVSIYAQMTAFFKGPVDAKASDTSDGTVAGNPVDHAIRTVIQPLSIGNNRIGRFNLFSEGKEKRTDHFPSSMQT